MEAKQKAKELFETFEMECSTGYALKTRNIAISVALICIDEIIKANPIVPLEFMLESEALDAAREYWQSVRQELINIQL